MRKSMIILPAALPLRVLADLLWRMLGIIDWSRDPMQSNWPRRKLTPSMLLADAAKLAQEEEDAAYAAGLAEEEAHSYLQAYFFLILPIILILLHLVLQHPLRWRLMNLLAPSI
jgi:hypothetical protein